MNHLTLGILVIPEGIGEVTEDDRHERHRNSVTDCTNGANDHKHIIPWICKRKKLVEGHNIYLLLVLSLLLLLAQILNLIVLLKVDAMRWRLVRRLSQGRNGHCNIWNWMVRHGVCLQQGPAHAHTTQHTTLPAKAKHSTEHESSFPPSLPISSSVTPPHAFEMKESNR